MNTNTSRVFCNNNLPANAIGCTDIVIGMYLLLAGGYTGRVTSVKWYGSEGVVIADGIRTVVKAWGTMRLDTVNHHEDYNYHQGHGCIAE